MEQIDYYSDNKLVYRWSFLKWSNRAFALCLGGSAGDLLLARFDKEGGRRTYTFLDIPDPTRLVCVEDRFLLLCLGGSVYELDPEKLTSHKTGEMVQSQAEWIGWDDYVELPETMKDPLLRGIPLLLKREIIRHGSDGLIEENEIVLHGFDCGSLRRIPLEDTVLGRENEHIRFLYLSHHGHVVYWKIGKNEFEIHKEGVKDPESYSFDCAYPNHPIAAVDGVTISPCRRMIAFVVYWGPSKTSLARQPYPTLMVCDFRGCTTICSIELEGLIVDGPVLQFSPDSGRLYVKAVSSLMYCELKNGADFKWHQILGNCHSFAFTPDNTRFYTCSCDGNIAVYDTGASKVWAEKNPGNSGAALGVEL